MNKKEKYNFIEEYLNKIITEPRCEINYSNEYELIIGVMLSAQTTDKLVNRVTKILFEKYTDLKSLSEASIDEVERIIKPIGFSNKKAKFVKSISEKLLNIDKELYKNREFLESLDGVGRKTANVVLSELYQEKVMAVDTHVLRVSKRLGLVNESDTVLKVEKVLSSNFNKERLNVVHLQLVLFGRYYCKSINPACDNCGMKHICEYYKGE